MVECEQVRCLRGRGIEGDRFLDFKGGYKGQITFFSVEVYDALCAITGIWEKPPSVLRRNVITAGADLNALIGEEFEVQNVRFCGMAECSPCAWMDQAFGPGAATHLKGRGGLRAKILTDGILWRDG
jgi:MOSC domain-containing protein YiiM